MNLTAIATASAIEVRRRMRVRKTRGHADRSRRLPTDGSRVANLSRSALGSGACPGENWSALKLLFVCARNQRRSPTAAAIYQNDPRFDVRSGGVAERSRRRVSVGDLSWADLVLVMERKHLRRLEVLHPDSDFDVRILDIPDEFEFMDADLIDLLRDAVDRVLIR